MIAFTVLFHGCMVKIVSENQYQSIIIGQKFISVTLAYLYLKKLIIIYDTLPIFFFLQIITCNSFKDM